MTPDMPIHSCMYIGEVVHTRFRPSRHRLRYKMLTFLLDLDELPRLAKRLSVFSVNRFNLFSFRERDHLARSATPLRDQLETLLKRAGIALDGGAVRVLCMPRVLGSSFNPISVYFCHGPDGGLRALLYEVNNTFGERHSYLIPTNDPDATVHQQSCEKAFFVSPFMDMKLRYHFDVERPGAHARIRVNAHDAHGLILSAQLTGSRQELTSGNLFRAFLRHPLLAFQVLGAIHWEALKLWRKRVPWQSKPAAPADPVSIVLPVRSA